MNQCRGCHSEELVNIIDFGEQPWCNDFLTKENIGKEKLYPLDLVCCRDCGLLQLSYTVPKEVIFFLAESSTKSVQLSSEHQNYIWLNFDSAHDRLTYTNAKELLVKAKSFLEK